jgi:4-aminobutyrate aminotransferase-like enzyme
LHRKDADDIRGNVIATGHMFRDSLQHALAGIRVVKEVRCFGLLIGIELDLRKSMIQRLGLNAAPLYLLRMMQHHGCPLLMGFCQYEPNVLKFTPPLTTTKDEVEKITLTISDALRSSTLSLLMTGIRALLRVRK